MCISARVMLLAGATRLCSLAPHSLNLNHTMPAVAASSRSTTNKENRGTAFALHAERSDDSDTDAAAPSSKARRVASGSSSAAARRAVSGSKGAASSSSSMPEDRVAALERRLEQVRLTAWSLLHPRLTAISR